MKELETVGGLWKKKSEAGRSYLNGTMKLAGIKCKVMVFRNEFKQEEKHPDYTIVVKDVERQTPAEDYDDFG